MRPGSTLLAFDFDGTLAPIQVDPSEVRLDRAAAALLDGTTQMEGVVVAIISGRDVRDLAERIPTSSAYLIGSHGLEVRAPGGMLIRDAPPLSDELPEMLREELEASGLRIERKKHAIALHWRGIPYPAIAPVVESFSDWARTSGLTLVEGRCVLEARCPGPGKEAALQWLKRAVGASRVVYAGDDTTDFAALEFANQHGLGLFVASDEREAPPGVRVIGSFRELFRVIREEVRI
jgi:trehalose-phosphatase